MLARRRVFATLAVAALALTLLLGAVTSALAAPSDPTLGLTELRQMLKDAPSHTVDGYFKTVLQGQTIEQIPVIIRGTTSGATPDTSLILFEATGAKIEKFGGIVAGMSGSPIYVDDAGTDKVVGAVSYGDWFTLAGTGLATPIESMLELRALSGASIYHMDSPVLADGRVITRVILSSSPQDLAGENAGGALVAKPLNTVFIGGLRPGSASYKMLSKAMAAKGLTVASTGVPLAAGPLDADSMVATDLVPGAAIAAMSARGDLWSGGIGTVTYAGDADVLAFGHPDYWNGSTSLYMMNAWIDGVWPSSMSAYKLGSPTVLRGTVTQDRFAGILGHMDEFPADTTITATARNLDTGESASSTVYMPRRLVNTGQLDGYSVSAGLSVAMQRLVDSYSIAGSANTTTTITVGDGDKVYTVVVPNFYDSTELDWDMTYDAWDMVDELQYSLESGTDKLDIMSIDLDIGYTATRSNAMIAAVDVVGGLKSGANTATVTYVVFGSKDFVKQEVPFTLPPNTPLSGTISAASSMGGYDYYYDYSDEYYSEDSGYSEVTTSGPISDWIWTVDGTVGDIEANQPNNVLALQYTPRGDTSSGSKAPVAIETSVTTPWYLTYSASLSSPRIITMLEPATVDYRDATVLEGIVFGPQRNSKVLIYGTPANSAKESLIATLTAKYDDDEEMATFHRTLRNYPTNMKLRIRVEQSDGWLSGDATCTIKVRPIVSFDASKSTLKPGRHTTLTANVWPAANAGSRVAFQVWNRGDEEWRTFATRTLVVSGPTAKASYSWAPAKGNRRVRARFLGSASNAAANSYSVTLHVKK